MSDETLPPALAEISEEFLAVGERDRLQLLLDFSRELPVLPQRLADHPELLERVAECQSPVFIVAEIEDGAVHLHATAPEEAPTTRGFASILVQGLEGLTPDEVLATPNDVAHRLGLGRAVSPLRLSGMSGMLARIKRQVAARVA
ncbi:cysteine desulfuration protein SufE [Labedella gwakjiensis]|uniref:Cysteine desulfuration protein SufE n=1 Tax=Labedella gwakjiensis TaxID=390269 RepID=A0A2P8GZP6_9MICO|nr:SufE family protein [Labedella gwakjiensis]PSL39444.1 cysteine desulfuration protein SufE [Labedella gwakjiensis]RUQ86152.1 SufE family protein [Labedella gwakjiensis]